MEEPLLVIDTNVIVHLARNDAYASRVIDALNLRQRRVRPVVSIVSVGEAHSMALRRAWGTEKLGRLADMFSDLVVAPITSTALAARFAQFQVKTQRLGRSVGQNDLWIAATCSIVGGILVTDDRDFDALVPVDIRRVLLDPNTGGILERPEGG